LAQQNQIKKAKRSAIISGIVLTLIGLIYSTLQTQLFIIKNIKEALNSFTKD
jgi:hypothetical protein